MDRITTLRCDVRIVELGSFTAAIDLRERQATVSRWVARLEDEGMGVALLVSWLVDADLDSGTLELVLPEWSAPRAPIQALVSSSKHTARAARAFIDFLEGALSRAWAERGRQG